MAVFLITVLLSLALTSTNIAAEDLPYVKCYTVDSRNECLFYTLNWKTSWNWAQLECYGRDGNLVSIKNAKMQDAVSHFYDLLHFGGENVWIGARRRADDWTWVGDLPLTDKEVSNQSKSSDFRVKAAVSKDTTIVARHSLDELPYVCQYEVGSAPCKDTSQYFDEDKSCFVFYSNQFMTWYDARNMCLKKGGDLATFKKVHDNVGVYKLATSPHWVGLRSSWWIWPGGSEVRYSNWQPGEPSDPDKMCVSISKEHPGMWKTEDCAAKNMPFICQKKDAIVVFSALLPCSFWCVVLIIACEAVLYCAWTQRQRIIRLCRKSRRSMEDQL